MLILGPDVSFNGSPTVSPTTAAACGPDPFPKNCFVLSMVLSISKSDAVIFNFPAKYYKFGIYLRCIFCSYPKHLQNWKMKWPFVHRKQLHQQDNQKQL